MSALIIGYCIYSSRSGRAKYPNVKDVVFLSVEVVTKLTEEGKIAFGPVKGGFILYLPEDSPVSKGSKTVPIKILEENEVDEGLEILGPADKQDES